MRLIPILALGLFLSWGEARAAVIFNAAADFSATNNPNGVWSYGQSATLGAPVQLYTQNGPDNVDPPPADLLDTWNAGAGGMFAVPAVYHNGTNGVVAFSNITYLPGELGFHPGPMGEFSVVRFTAPTSGSYSLVSSYRPIDLATTTDVHVLLNGVSLFSGNVNPNAPTSFNDVLSLTAGDTLDFAVGNGNGSYFNDSTGISVVLTSSAVPEPSTLTLALLGLGIGCCRRFRRGA